MHVHDRRPSLDPALGHASELHLGPVDVDPVQPVGLERLRRDPRFHDEDAPRLEVAGHLGNSGLQLFLGTQVADGAEQADHRVEAPSQIEVQHVAVMQGDARQLATGDRQHGLVQIDPLHFEELLEEAQVFPGAAGHVQQAPQRPPRVALQQGTHAIRLAGVILEAVDEVVPGGGLRVHRSRLGPAAARSRPAGAPTGRKRPGSGSTPPSSRQRSATMSRDRSAPSGRRNSSRRSRSEM